MRPPSKNASPLSKMRPPFLTKWKSFTAIVWLYNFHFLWGTHFYQSKTINMAKVTTIDRKIKAADFWSAAGKGLISRDLWGVSFPRRGRVVKILSFLDGSCDKISLWITRFQELDFFLRAFGIGGVHFRRCTFCMVHTILTVIV